MKRHIAVLEGVASLHDCVLKGDIPTIERLSKIPGIDFACKDEEGRSPLRLACEMMGAGRPDGVLMVQTLLDMQLPHFLVNRHSDCLTVAFFAYINGSPEALALIPTYGLQPSIAHVHPLRVMDFYTASLVATYSEQVGKSTWMSQLLSFQDAMGQNVFHHLCRRGSVSGLRFVVASCSEVGLDYQGSLNAMDTSLCRPIEYAAESGNVQLIIVLKEAGAAVLGGEYSYDPFRICLWFGHVDAFQYLLNVGLEGVSVAELRDSANEFWLLQRDSAIALAPGLETFFPENPTVFHNMKTLLAINRIKMGETEKEQLRIYRSQMYGIQKILIHLDSLITYR